METKVKDILREHAGDRQSIQRSNFGLKILELADDASSNRLDLESVEFQFTGSAMVWVLV